MWLTKIIFIFYRHIIIQTQNKMSILYLKKKKASAQLETIIPE